jgi:methylenetetrahydrofolate reductase-like protein
MRIDHIIEETDEPVFSFEFFPPKSDAGERVLGLALESLRQLEPAFVSVTYGAGGSSRGRTLELTKWIKQELGIEAMRERLEAPPRWAELLDRAGEPDPRRPQRLHRRRLLPGGAPGGPGHGPRPALPQGEGR